MHYCLIIVVIDTDLSIPAFLKTDIGHFEVQGGDVSMEKLDADTARKIQLRWGELPPEHLFADTMYEFSVSISNDTDIVLCSSNPFPIMVSYHWYDRDNHPVVYEGIRSELVIPIAPGETHLITASVLTPSTAGEFKLCVTLIQEYVQWFNEPPIDQSVAVSASIASFSTDNAKASNNKSRYEILEFMKHHFKYIYAQTPSQNLLIPTADHVATNAFYVQGRGYDVNGFKLFMHLSNQYYPKKSGIFIEAGGNVGSTAILAAKTAVVSNVLSFEPSSENCKLFAINILLNDIPAEKVKLINAALSNSDSTMKLELCATNYGDCQICTDGVDPLHATTEDSTSEIVKAVKLDNYLSLNGIDPAKIGFFWLDVQGFEGFALDGARKITAAYIPAVVEIWPSVLKKKNCFDMTLDILLRNYSHFISLKEYESGRTTLAPITDLEEFTVNLTKEDSFAFDDLFLIKNN